MTISIESQIQSLLDITDHHLIKLNVATVFDLRAILEESVREIVSIKNSLTSTQLYIGDIYVLNQQENSFEQDVPDIKPDEHLTEEENEELIISNEEPTIVVVKIEEILKQIDDDYAQMLSKLYSSYIK